MDGSSIALSQLPHLHAGPGCKDEQCQLGVHAAQGFFFWTAPGPCLATGYGEVAGFGHEFGHQALPGPFVWPRRAAWQRLCNGSQVAPGTVTTSPPALSLQLSFTNSPLVGGIQKHRFALKRL
jgi:hypothetical protein